MNNNNNFIDNELIFSKKRKLEKGKKEESYSDLTIKNHVHKPQSLLRKCISESEFNFNIPSTSINNSLIDSWRPLLNENKLTSQYQDNINGIENKNENEYEYEKIIINEPPDVPNIEEFDEKNETYSFNRNTLQYEFIPEGMINEGNNSYLYNNYSNYNYPLQEMGASNDNGINRNIHRQESSLIPFKQDSQIILYNNNNTGQVVLYNKTNKSLSIHKIRPNSKEIMSRNNRCILCNQLLPSERERINTNNMFKNRRAYTDTKYFRLLACSLSYNRKPSITSANNNNLNESNNFSIHTVNSAENIINLLNDNSSNNTECINHPSITITTSQSNPNPDFNENINKNGIKEVDDIKNENENENENKSTENIKSDQNNGKSNTTTYLSSSSFNNGYYERFFIERKKLGRGFRGSVFLCHHILDQVFLGEYAVKKVAVGNNHQWLVRMLKEVMLLEKLRNPNIIEYKHAWLEEHTLSSFGPKVPCLFILMERANGGNLEEYVQLQWNPEEQLEKALSAKERIKRKRLRMKEAQNQIKDNRAQFFGGIGYDSFGKRVRYLTTEAIWKIFLDICYGLNHLHELGIIHRDLKPPNLLLQYKDPNNQEEIPKVLISDFGECEILSHLEKRQRTGATGTLEFMAELLISDEAGHYYDDYSSNSDLWSLGVVLYYICFSEMPYSQVDDIDILKNEILNYSTVHFKNDNNSNRVPKELKTLIKKLMIKEPTKRPKAKEILELYGGFKNDSSIRIETDSENLSNSTLNQKDPVSSIKSMTSNEIINNSKKIDEKQLPNINDKNLSPLSPCQDIPTSIPTNKFKGKEKEKEKDNEDENTNKNKNEIKNKIENDSIEEDINRSRNNNEIEEEKEWLNKELVDEPLSFNIEKRIIPFNHNRSKSLPYLLNNSKFNTNSKDNNNNGIVQDSIKEEENDNFDKEYNKKINTYPPLEKSLVPFQENKIKSFDRPLPSPTYPPLKNNDRENKYKRSYKNIWINEKDNSRELIRKEMKINSNHYENEKRAKVPNNSMNYLINRNILISNFKSFWNLITKKSNLKLLLRDITIFIQQDIKNDLKQNKKNKNYNKSQTLKRKNNKKSSSYHPRHTYQNSKIYFTHLPRRTNTISIINTKNNNNGEKVSEKIKEKQLTPFKPNYSQLKVQNHNKVMKILQQKSISLNIILFLLKTYLLYQALYPNKLFFSIIILFAIYNSNILRFNVFRVLVYSAFDISLLYLLKLFFSFYIEK